MITSIGPVTEHITPLSLQDGIARLWDAGFTNASAAFASSEFSNLVQACIVVRSKAGCAVENQQPHQTGFCKATKNFFLNVGGPWWKDSLVPEKQVVADSLWNALIAEEHTVTYLIPLDRADDLPAISFGPWRIGQLSTQEMSGIIKSTKIARHYDGQELELKKFSQLQWAVLQTTEKLNSPDQQAFPFLKIDLRDVGRVKPHPETFPSEIEHGLFVLTLLPWEVLEDTKFVFWQPFRFPWVYRVPESPFMVQQPLPPTHTLSWGLQAGYEDEVFEVPDRMGLDVSSLPTPFEDGVRRIWSLTESLMPIHGTNHPALNPLVKHFMFRAFNEYEFDQVLWHMFALDCLVGNKGHGSAMRIAARAAAILHNNEARQEILKFYGWRSDFVHGREVQEKELWEGDLRTLRKIVRSVVIGFMELCEQHPNSGRKELLGILDRNVA